MITLFTTYPLLICIASFIVGLACMPIVRKIAQEKHFVVKPNKRTSHTGEIPNIGGLDICFSFLLCYLLFEVEDSMLRQSHFLLVGMFVITMIGFTDDVLDLSPLSKLLGEALAGISLIGFADIRLTHLHGFLGIGEIDIVSSYLLSFFVLTVIVNALNLIDGIDGLASGLGILYCLCFGVYFQCSGNGQWAALAYSMTGALAVFFLYNVFGRSKRKMFMGDSGSLLLGYVLTAFVFQFCELNAYHRVPEALQCNAAPAVALCILSVPLFDTLRVMGTRIKHRKSPFLPDKNHIHHLLLRTGLNHIETTCLLMAVTLFFILLAFIGHNWSIWLLTLTDLVCCLLLTWILWRVVDYKSAKAQ
ncbi:MAG: undecaprenyl/decaprenyl-phosphate alpha-N-acetylglucosaminyl 1-phosphate transferase [Paludibacter sp.]|nr:undecaprenyl/decaprenyl-phosphate alpha-N-acetylglucosaminyl 1-phosphate transferase [Bacteroidales bacterium]MCM1069609.1 undecaprenyl/decaprenyl-phosphate alpha-N-acetylglucosaminyl 1-phosphate transferase [Prevotella sp.]MCM1354255.1 undecaprenyl/decaprenyl-phosphate alpha-N-acetylglucosaminyl 1-phosphate transferase [Bacteroides sp.]MCM1443094.1 undecaprenyl/decaprenyl-phosphate alpha-N-acetylglucosaminyl 1-phosphate transferase [Muribaculum sp.]MCM1482329.1 undecaprenyl/decaprenyl-phosp